MSVSGGKSAGSLARPPAGCCGWVRNHLAAVVDLHQAPEGGASLNCSDRYLVPRFWRIGDGVCPVVWWHDLGLDTGMLGEQVKQV